jgi:hypothetical protein
MSRFCGTSTSKVVRASHILIKRHHMHTVEMTVGHPSRRGMPRAQGTVKFPALSAVRNKISDIFNRYLAFSVLPGERNETRSTR